MTPAPSWVYVGAKITPWVEDDVWRAHEAWNKLAPNTPHKGVVYTIRAVELGADSQTGEELVAILLKEIHNPLFLWEGHPQEPNFTWRGFQPVIERKTDISVFQKLLRPAPVYA